jgi:hypothetical protein
MSPQQTIDPVARRTKFPVNVSKLRRGALAAHIVVPQAITRH